MAYTGFISNPDFARKDLNETIKGSWTFGSASSPNTPYVANGKWTFTNEINGTALYAKWGDLAEIYECDEDEVLVPGTLVKFGGEKEVTKTGRNDKNFFGVISTKPGVVLNKKEQHGQKIALVGKVPVRVIGKVKKFDKLTTSYIPGVAKRKTLLDTLLLKPTIGRALKTDTNSNEKLVDIFVKSHI